MSARTTYSDLTRGAAGQLGQALSLAVDELGPDEVRTAGELRAAVEAHRDVSAALAHLGRVLTRPPVRTDGAVRYRSRRGGPDVRTVRTLARRGRPCDWASEPPASGTAGHSLWAAARSIRAAADLWATHRTPSGADRSPEASRLRHPSVLGAATREWRALIRITGEVADALLHHADNRSRACSDQAEHGSGHWAAGAGVAALSPDDLAALRDYPRPLLRPRDLDLQPVPITVARPGARSSADAVDRIADGVDRVRHAAWLLAASGTAPAAALANLATIGVMVNSVARQVLDQAAAGDGHASPRGADPVLGQIDAAAARARIAAARWSVVAGLVVDLRSPHPPTSALQIERLDLGRLLEDVRRSAQGPRLVEVAAELGRQADRLSEIAAMNLRAAREAHERGDLYVLGRALPQESLVRRPDLVDAKLTGRVVPAPVAVLRRLEVAYQAIAEGAARTDVGDGSSPAA